MGNLLTDVNEKRFKLVGYHVYKRPKKSVQLTVYHDYRGKFLKKLCCCVAWRIKQGNFVLPNESVT